MKSWPSCRNGGFLMHKRTIAAVLLMLVPAFAPAQAVDRAIDFLQNRAQAPDGSYAAYGGPGVTAVVTASILRHGRTPNDPVVAKSLKYLEGFAQPDGAISLK